MRDPFTVAIAAARKADEKRIHAIIAEECAEALRAVLARRSVPDHRDRAIRTMVRLLEIQHRHEFGEAATASLFGRSACQPILSVREQRWTRADAELQRVRS